MARLFITQLPTGVVHKRSNGQILVMIQPSLTKVSYGGTKMNPVKAVPLCLPANCRWDKEHQEVVFDTTAERENIVLCQEGLDVLKNICKPVVVICITGPARSGKSFFLSQIQDGVHFEVGHGTTAKTTGIWIASGNRLVKKNEHEAAVVLLDTEGLCSVSTTDNNTDATWDKKLFTLSLLVSSYFIFNSQGTPTFRDLDKLSFVGKLKEHLQSPRDGSVNPDSSPPDFLWLVRDAHLQPEVQGQRCGWSRYLKESVLKSRHDRRNDPTNLTRKAVVKTFAKIDAHGLPFPSTDPDVLANLGSLEGSNGTQPAFSKSIQSVKEKIFNVAKEKTINGRTVSGRDLAYVIEIYTEQLNNESGIIDVQSTWECLVAVEEAEIMYTNEMKLFQKKMPCSSLELRRCHNDAKRKATTELLARTRLSSQFAKEVSTRKFALHLEYELKSYQSKNLSLSRNQCQKIEENLILQYLQPVIDDPSQYTLKDFEAAKEKVLENYNLMAQGPGHDEIRLHLISEMTRKTSDIQKLVMHEGTKIALHLYEEEMSGLQLPCANCELDERHEEAFKLAVNKFEGISSGGEMKLSKEYRKLLETNIHDKRSAFAENNDCFSLETCQKIMDNLAAQHLNPLLHDLEHNSYQTLTKAAQKILQAYEATAIGPKKEVVREQEERVIKDRLKQSQAQIAQMAVKRAVSIYKNHMQKITLPCSEGSLYRTDQKALKEAKEKFTTDLNDFPPTLIQTQEQNLRWDLHREFSIIKSKNFAYSRQKCQRLAKELEEKHGLQDVLRNPVVRDESTVRKIVNNIARDYKFRADSSHGPAAEEIQEEFQAKYVGILKQCRMEDRERTATAIAGIVTVGGLAVWGLIKLFGSKDSDDDD